MKRNAIVLASILAALLAAGCGKQADKLASQDATTTQPVGFEPAGEEAHALPNPSRSDAATGASGALSADSLPPDVSVSAPDTLLLPGAAVELIARGTPDVVEVTLWDGVGQKQQMTYDTEGKVWKGYYRVPLRFSVDRLALSVTAKSGSGKWRRVWVSLKVQHEATEPKPESGSGS